MSITLPVSYSGINLHMPMWLSPLFTGSLHFSPCVVQVWGLTLRLHAHEFYITPITQCGRQYHFEGEGLWGPCLSNRLSGCFREIWVHLVSLRTVRTSCGIWIFNHNVFVTRCVLVWRTEMVRDSQRSKNINKSAHYLGCYRNNEDSSKGKKVTMPSYVRWRRLPGTIQKPGNLLSPFIWFTMMVFAKNEKAHF